MLKKTITYTDLNGVKRTEDFYFNLNKAELLKMELGVAGGFVEKLQKIITSGDTPALMEEFEKFIFNSYGEKSDDGKRFIKSKELSEAFTQTEAYSELFLEISTDHKAASDFLIGIIPGDIAEKIPENYMDSLPDNVKDAIQAATE